jgi:hypothetical protein
MDFVVGINILMRITLMNDKFEQRIQSIEDQLKALRKELEDSLARYKQSQYPFTNGDISKFRSGAIGDTPQFVPITFKEFNDRCKVIWEES